MLYILRTVKWNIVQVSPPCIIFTWTVPPRIFFNHVIYQQWCRNKGGGDGEIYPPNSLRMVHICITPNNLNGCTSERKCGEKSKWSILAEDFFFVCSSSEFVGKSVSFAFYFWSPLNFNTWTKSWSRFIPPTLKIGQNCSKEAPPQRSTKIGTTVYQQIKKIYLW